MYSGKRNTDLRSDGLMTAYLRAMRHDTSESHIADAARELFKAELALHDARMSGVDTWIAAAADHLHRAAQAYAGSLPVEPRVAA
jgi:hypothetical protein